MLPLRRKPEVDKDFFVSVQAYNVYDEGAKQGHFLSRMQRSLYNAKAKLRAKPFWVPEETPYLKSMKYAVYFKVAY